MSNWYMLTVVGRDRPGIVSEVTGAIFTKQNCLDEKIYLDIQV